MQEIIKKIIEAAVRAPSGENCQPWRIKLSEGKIELFNDPLKDTSLYNYDQKGSMVAIGAFIENLIIASKELGLNPTITMFPDSTNLDWVSTISFSQTTPVSDPLFDSIFSRTTNRKQYKKVSITAEYKKSLIDSATEVNNAGAVVILEDADKIKELSVPISLNERLIFENQFLHNFFYNHIRWTKEEDNKYKDGFYIETLELKAPQKFALKLLRSWKWAKIAKKFGMSKQIASDNAKNYASASALGIIVIPSNNRQDYVFAGRIMQRVWLKTTLIGLSLQPMTGVLFFKQRIQKGDCEEFTDEQKEMINNAYTDIKNGFGVGDGNIAMLFRVGDGGTPSALSSRFLVNEIIFN